MSPRWSDPSKVSWIFDGRMDMWVQDRESQFASAFTDIYGHVFENAINWLADQNITNGCNPPINTRYCLDDSVTEARLLSSFRGLSTSPHRPATISPTIKESFTRMRLIAFSRQVSRWGVEVANTVVISGYRENKWQPSWLELWV